MTELRSVRLKDILPNPFRGDMPLVGSRVESLVQSIQASGWWDGYLIVRPVRPSGTYELAFGHHRLAALNQLYAPEHKIVVCVQDLDDGQMIVRLANENNEEYNHLFFQAVMVPIRALVQAYAEGKVQLEKPDPKATEASIRYADLTQRTHPYTALTVARYLGWTHKGGRSGERAADRVLTALAALELVESKVLTEKDFMALGAQAAMATVRLYSDRRKADEKAIQTEIDKRSEERESTKDPRKIEQIDRKLETLQKQLKDVPKVAKAQAKEVAKELGDDHLDEILGNAGYKFDNPVKEPKQPKTEREVALQFKTKVEAFLREDQSGWTATAAYARRNPKFKAELYAELERLIERARNRRKELS